MLTVVHETLITEIDEVKTDGTAVKDDLLCVDVLVCALCHKGFHFLEEFQEHKHKPGRCKKISAYRKAIPKVKKKTLEIYGFLLWKNSIGQNKKTRKMYKFWCYLPVRVRYSWMQAAKMINTYDELTKTIPDSLPICDDANVL